MRADIQSKNFDGKERRIGFEIEYAGPSLKQTAEMVRGIFGGKIHKVTDAVFAINDTEFGDFKLELDAIPMQKVAENTQKLKKNSQESLVDEIGVQLGKAISDASTKIVPFEIVTPPIPISKLTTLEKLRIKLLEAGAKDTKDNFYAAFGLHINPEAVSLEAEYLVRHLQSFLLLAPWLIELHKIDITRKFTNFVDPFPKSYLERVLDKKYVPEMDRLIKDYHTHNPTRNRALDMLPLFAYINEKLVRDLYGEEEKINKRPTFHYRLPNCELSDKNWSLEKELERWFYVERLATDGDLLHKLIEKWKQHQDNWISLESEWIKLVKTAMEA